MREVWGELIKGMMNMIYFPPPLLPAKESHEPLKQRGERGMRVEDESCAPFCRGGGRVEDESHLKPAGGLSKS